jgi:hypothetical protein
VNRFAPGEGGSRYRVTATIRLKGALRLLPPFLRGYVRKPIRELYLAPVKMRAEASEPAAEVDEPRDRLANHD